MNKLKFLFLLVFTFSLFSCVDLEVQNLNQPDRGRALSNPSDLLNILKGGTMDAITGITTSWGVHPQLMADQTTSTNKYRAFWDFCEEPRLQLQNNVNYDGAGAMRWPWSDFNSGVVAANSILSAINDGLELVVEDSIDRTTDAEAAAYFIKGFSQGFIGVMYDKGYIVNIDSDLSGLEFVDYHQMIAEGLANIQQAITIAGAHADLHYDFILNVDMDRDEFVQMCYSYMARIAISEPRTKDEAPATSWAAISGWADQGFDHDFYIETAPGEWWNFMIDWAATEWPPGAGYLPSDMKIFHLVDPAHYTEYYHQDSVYTDTPFNDQRILGANGNKPYYMYMTNFGYLRASRNRFLFSSYMHFRFSNNNDLNQAGYMNPMFLYTELQLIKAECALKGGDINGALAVINDPNLPRKADGGLPDATAANEAEAVNLLHYEYALELDLAGGSTCQWAFMRRWDLLQEGTPTEFPIPARELEATGFDIYTFGGVNHAGEPGTALGPGWRTVANGQ